MNDKPLEYQPAGVKVPQSRAGVLSLVMGALCWVGLGLSMVVRPGTASGSADGPSVAVARLIGVACVVCPLVGFVLGIAGVRSANRKHTLAIIGLCLNASVLGLLAAMVALFLMMR